MSTLEEELTRLQTAKESIITKIKNKGVMVPDETKLDGIPPYIDDIPTGSSNISSQVIFSGTAPTELKILYWAANVAPTVANLTTRTIASGALLNSIIIFPQQGLPFFVQTSVSTNKIILNCTTTSGNLSIINSSGTNLAIIPYSSPAGTLSIGYSLLT